MGKGRARRKGTGKRAYLKHHSSGYDPLSPYALKSRGPRGINIAALSRVWEEDPLTKKKTMRLVEIEYSATQTHGKRGLTLTRATGPTAVAPHAQGKPTSIPRAEVIAKLMDKKAHEEKPIGERIAIARERWQGMRRSGLTEYHRIVICDFKDDKKITYYSLELYFSGSKFFFFQENLRTMVQCRSREYKNREDAMEAYRLDRIYWSEVINIPPSTVDPPEISSPGGTR